MIHRLCSIVAIILAVGLMQTFPHQVAADEISIEQPWSRATAPSAQNGAAFMTIRNTGSEAETLYAAATERADRVELHTHLMEDGVMKMRKVETIEIPADGEALLKPGGLHVMFFGLKSPLREGETFPVELRFEKAGNRTVEVTVMGAGSKSPMSGHGHGGGHGKN